MHTTPRYDFSPERFRRIAAAGNLARYGITIDNFDPNDINPEAPTTDDSTIGDLIRGAWMLGGVTGPAEPLFLYEKEPDHYSFRFDLGQHPARIRLLTDAQEWRHLSANDLAGTAAAISVLEKMVTELNATVAMHDNYLALLGVS